MVVFPFPNSFYGNDGTKFPEKSAFDPRSAVVNNAGTMTRKLSGQKRAVLGAGKLGGHSSSRLSQAGAVFAKACERNGTPRR